MEIPEMKEGDADVSYRLPGNALTWALEYAFGLGQEHASIGAETAARMVVQSLAGRNLILVVHPVRITKLEYEG